MRNKTTFDMVRYKIKELNKYLASFDQRIVLSDKKLDQENEIYWDLIWYRPLDKSTEAEEHIFGGDDWELYGVLNGIEYGIRMEREGTFTNYNKTKIHLSG
ncbi:hypothetical protein CHH57_02040 [Niallia circulans]|uniref:Uncharacterized protein n=1 Tax=Niallia circulans TaxID=1397 RepID=A0AA91TW19_NIACI|nr:hypothetical protein [Niallia circulans]PAD84978.1 hypothetical protein CHH57_02040 [Niallia circulans]